MEAREEEVAMISRIMGGILLLLRMMVRAWSILLAMTAVCAAGEWYLGPGAAGPGDDGSASSPWKSWEQAQGSLKPGDALHCAGDLGVVRMTKTSPAGTASAWIHIRQWNGKDQATIRTLSFDGTRRDAYLEFQGIRFDPGYVADADFTTNVAVNLDGASHVVFDGCQFEGPKLAGAEGDFKPYCVNSTVSNPPTVTAGHPANASHVTITNCTFGYSSVAIRICEDPRTGKTAENWRILNSEFREASEDFILLNGGSNSLVAGNRFSDQNSYRTPFEWPGEPTGDWGRRPFARVTQDSTGASGIFYRITKAGRILILADDRAHLPSRNTKDVWRLDDDPQKVFFTPSASGDNAHSDVITLMGIGAHDITVERNYMAVGEYGAQVMKIDAHGGHPENNLFQNNIMLAIGRRGQAFMVIFEGGRNCILRHNLIHKIGGQGGCVRVNEIKNIGQQRIILSGNIIDGILKSQGNVRTDHNVFLSAPQSMDADATDLLLKSLDAVGVVDGREWRLSAGSPCIDKGNPEPDVSVGGTHARWGGDYDGSKRDASPDIGPVEYSSQIIGRP